MFDAYTVKKVLPKLFAAVILIQLSWFLFTGVIQAVNVIAYGIEGLIYAPYGGVQNLQIGDILSQAGGGGVGLGFAGIVVGAGAVVVGAIAVGGILATALIALLGVLIAFMLLMFRQVIIVGLLVISPLALVAWILPSTEKYWKLWWESFFKLLLVYPIILGMVAIGRVFAMVIGNANPSGVFPAVDDIVTFIMIAVCVIGPFYLIPKTFQMAGGAFTALTGAVNNKGAGAFDRLRKRRSQTRAKNLEDLKAGNRFHGGTDNNFRGRLNRGLLGASMISKAGANPAHMRTKMRQAMRDHAENSVEEAMKHESFTPWSGDDAKLWAARHTTRQAIADELVRQDAGRFGGEANRNRREEAVAQIMRSQREMGTETFQRARLQAQSKTGTGYQRTVVDEDGNEHTVFDASMMLDDINEVYGADRNGAGKALASMKNNLTQSGQIAGQAGYGTWARALEGRNDNRISEVDAHDAIMADTINSVSPGHAVYGKPASAAALARAHAQRIQAINAGITSGTHTKDDLDAAMAAAAGIYDAMGQASPQNASAFANELMSMEITDVPITQTSRVPKYNADGSKVVDASGHQVFDTVTNTIDGGTVREYITAQMGDGNTEFANRRRDLSQATLAQAQQAQAAQAAAGGGGPVGGPPSFP